MHCVALSPSARPLILQFCPQRLSLLAEFILALREKRPGSTDRYAPNSVDRDIHVASRDAASDETEWI